MTTSLSPNALSVLLSALPGNIATSIEDEFSLLTSEYLPSATAPLATPAASSADRQKTAASDTQPIDTSALVPSQSLSASESSPPTLIQSSFSVMSSDPPATSISPSISVSVTSPLLSLSSTSVSVSVSSRTSITTSTTSSSSLSRTSLSGSSSSNTLSTKSTLPTSTSSSSSSSSSSTSGAVLSAATTSASNNQLKTGAIAGVATGAIAGVVLLLLISLYVFRRRQQGKPIFGRRRSQRSNRSGGSHRFFPEVAWLYDPAPSPPPEEHTPPIPHRLSNASTTPEPREGAIEMRELEDNWPLRSPEMRSVRPSSPLLAPPSVGAARAESPSGSSRAGSPAGSSRGTSPAQRKSPRSSAGTSRTDLGRPLTAIYEEVPRLSGERLLSSENVRLQRHSRP